MARSQDSPEHGEAEQGRHGMDKTDDGADQKKTQVQRLFEFEVWRNDKALKDLEYSQRRTEKKLVRKERRKAQRNRCWKKLYLPSVLGMVGGTFLTLCGTLQSLAGDTFLWNARGTLVILGPIMAGVGFFALMLAAGCTFKYDQEARRKPINRPSEFLMYNSDTENELSRPSATLRSISVDTTDLPMPEDLDPSTNYMPAQAAWPRNTQRTERVLEEDSLSRSPFLVADSSYNSTASWVQFVSAAHSQQRTLLTRQNSDSNLVSSAARCDRHLLARHSLIDSSDVPDNLDSQSEFNVVCTRSLTSSGYQSASDSTTGTVEYQVSSETSGGVIHSYTSLRHSGHRSPVNAIIKSSEPESGQNEMTRSALRGLHKDAFDSGMRPAFPDPPCQRDRLTVPETTYAIPRSSRCRSYDFLQRIHNDTRSPPVGGVSCKGQGKDGTVPVSTDTSIHFTAASLHGITGFDGSEQTKGAHTCCNRRPLYLEPQVYASGTVRCTDL